MININIVLAFIAALAGITNFTYDAAMINSLNILESFLTYFDIDSMWTGVIVAMINFGSIAAVPLSGPVLDRYGRRRGMMLGSILGLIGAVLQASSFSKPQLLVGRFLIGASLIFTASGGPPWLMEIAPPKYRRILTNSMLGTLPLIGVAVGILTLYLYEYNTDWSWRGGLMGEIAGPLISLIILPFTPESVRYLISQGRNDEALKVLSKLRGTTVEDTETLDEFRQIVLALEHERNLETNDNKWAVLIKPAPNFRRFLIAILTQIFFQTNGSNFMAAFLTLVLERAGVESVPLLLKISIGNTAWAAVATIIGIYLIERVGARPMFLWSTASFLVCFVLLSIFQNRSEVTGEKGFGMAAVVICFIFQFGSFSTWILLGFSYPSEILTYSQRARGMTVSQAIGYMFAALMTFTIPLAIEHIPWQFFVICAVWTTPMLPAIWFLFPNTKGKTLEEIDALFEGPASEQWLHKRGVIEGVPNEPEKGVSVNEIAEVKLEKSAS